MNKTNSAQPCILYKHTGCSPTIYVGFRNTLLYGIIDSERIDPSQGNRYEILTVCVFIAYLCAHICTINTAPRNVFVRQGNCIFHPNDSCFAFHQKVLLFLICVDNDGPCTSKTFTQLCVSSLDAGLSVRHVSLPANVQIQYK